MPAISVQGVELRGNEPSHEQYLGSLLAGRWEAFTAELFAGSVPRGGTVIDGGAYLGFYTLLAARLVGPEGAVFAFEPNPETFTVLCRNIAENGYEDRVVPMQLGLGARPGRERFYLADGDASESSLFRPEHSKGATEAECTSFDRGLGGRPVDVAKLDIEGGEVEALRGMRDSLGASPDPALFVECNPRALARAGVNPRALLGELESAGFAPHVIEDERGELRPPGPTLATIEGHVNLYCRRDGRAPAPADG